MKDNRPAPSELQPLWGNAVRSLPWKTWRTERPHYTDWLCVGAAGEEGWQLRPGGRTWCRAPARQVFRSSVSRCRMGLEGWACPQ